MAGSLNTGECFFSNYFTLYCLSFFNMLQVQWKYSLQWLYCSLTYLQCSFGASTNFHLQNNAICLYAYCAQTDKNHLSEKIDCYLYQNNA